MSYPVNSALSDFPCGLNEHRATNVLSNIGRVQITDGTVPRLTTSTSGWLTVCGCRNRSHFTATILQIFSDGTKNSERKMILLDNYSTSLNNSNLTVRYEGLFNFLLLYHKNITSLNHSHFPVLLCVRVGM